jgi:O-antigen biosynthesis protein
MPKISVIMPAYNHENFVGLAIQSVLDQTFQDFELIIVDDGSQDRTVEEILKFSDHRIKLILHEKNLGGAAAMQTCLEHSTGKYVAVINSDDLFTSNKLERQLVFLETHPVYHAVFSYIELIDETGNTYSDSNHPYFTLFEQKNRNRHKWLNHFFFYGNCLCHPTVLIRRECYDKIGYYNCNLAQLPDFDFWIRFCLKFELFVLPEKLLKFRILPNEQNVSSENKISNIRTYNELSWVLENFLKIFSIQEFLNVFPEISLNEQQIQTHFIPFLFARLALSNPHRNIQKFGIDKLFEILKEPSEYEKIRTAFNFSYTDFIKISGKIDSLNQYFDWYTYLYIDSGNGFNEHEKLKLEADFNKNEFSYTFDLSQYPSVKSLRWDPVECRICDVLLKDILYNDDQSTVHRFDLNSLQSNAEFQESGTYHFDTLDPMFFFTIQGKLSLFQIQGSWNIFNAWHTSQRLSELKKELYKTNNEISLLKGKVAAKDGQIHQLNDLVTAKDGQIHQLNDLVTAKDGQIHQLNDLVTAKDEQIHQLDDLVTAKDEQIHQLDDLVTAKDEQIHHLDGFLIEKEHQRLSLEISLMSIHNSLTWKLLKKYDNNSVKLLPGNTTRRKYYELILAGLRLLINEGPKTFIKKIKGRLNSNISSSTKKMMNTTPNDISLIREEIKKFSFIPKISIITPVYNVEEKWLRLCIESVRNQFYENWELCLVDDASTKSHIKKVLREYSNNDPRIKVKYLNINKGISGASNEALSLATGEFIHLFDNDDELSPDALFEIVKSLNIDNTLDLIYSDEDKIDRLGNYFEPFFKPDWSPDLLNSFMYIGHSTYRKTIVDELGGFRSDYDFSQDYDLALRVTERTQKIGHIPKILYHWRALPSSAASGGKNYARESNIAALKDAIKRRGYNAEAIIYPFANRIKFNLSIFPLISIIIPTDDKENLFSCVNSIVKKTDYPNFEIVIVTNSFLGKIVLDIFKKDTRIRVANYDKKFNFCAKCNTGAQAAKGDYFLFLNDDIEVIYEDWLENMVEIFGRAEVGAVAPKLIYEDDTVQHAGLVTGVRGLVGTAFHQKPEKSTDYFNLIQSTRDVSALSGACLLVPKTIFELVQGFDEINTPTKHSDFDFCFRIRENGYLLIYTPFTTLRHKGHKSIGKVEKSSLPTSFDKADIYLIKRWGHFISQDPYYTTQMRDYLYENASSGFRLICNKRYEQSGIGKNKNILFVSHDLSLSGAPISLFNISSYLFEKGNFVIIISPYEGPLIKKFEEIGIPVIVDASVIDNPEGETRKFFSNFDLIIANTILSWRLVYISNQQGIPVVWFVHESEFGKNLADCNPDIAAAFNVADLILFPSHAAARLYKKFCKTNNSGVMQQGICITNSDGSNINHQTKKFKILHVGSIEPRKGQDILIDCISKLPYKYLEIFEFYIVGRVLDSKFNSSLMRSIKSYNNVHLLGQITDEELVSLQKIADLFVCTSRDETFSLTILEAMSHGTAIISSNIGPIPEIVDNEINGILIPKEDPDSLKNNIIRLYENEKLRNYLGSNAKRKFYEMFTSEKYGERFLKTIQKWL